MTTRVGMGRWDEGWDWKRIIHGAESLFCQNDLSSHGAIRLISQVQLEKPGAMQSPLAERFLVWEHLIPIALFAKQD